MDESTVARRPSLAPGWIHRWRSRWALLVAAGVVLLIAGALLIALRLAATHTIQGSLQLYDSTGYMLDGDTCSGADGYADLQQGAAVTVADESGRIIATTQLGAGRRDGPYCAFPFKVSNVPSARFYQIEVSHRGRVTFPADKLEAGERADLSVGG